MRRLILLIPLLLAGCGDSGTPPDPHVYCVTLGEEVCGGRGGCYNKCIQEAIGCPKPLVMTTDPADTSGRLLCRMYAIPNPNATPIPQNGMANGATR